MITTEYKGYLLNDDIRAMLKRESSIISSSFIEDRGRNVDKKKKQEFNTFMQKREWRREK